MDTPDIVNPPEPNATSSQSSSRSVELKLLGAATDGRLMMFEEAVPPGKQSKFHLHHDSDEAAYVLSGEVTFKIGEELTICGPGMCAFMPRGVAHAWKSTGAETGRVLFHYTPAGAGGLLEEQQRTQRKFAAMTEAELADILQRHGWEIVGPSPL